jgi:hypothetical protein
MANAFKVGDIVKTVPTMATQKDGGEVRFIACGDARASVGTCDKKTCVHAPQDYVWIRWPGQQGLGVFHYAELDLDAANILLAERKKEDLACMPTEEVKVIPGDVKEKIEQFIGKKPLEAKDLDFDIYNGFKRPPNNSGNLVFPKR